MWPLSDVGVLERSQLDSLIEALRNDGYSVIGPTCRDQAIVLDELESAADLPAGWTDEQSGGSYRLARRKDMAVFGHNPGPLSWKRYLSPPRLRLWQVSRDTPVFDGQAQQAEPPPVAFFGVRPCDLHAIEIKDKVFTAGAYCDSVYQTRRQRTFIVVAQCAQSSANCFCTSLETGPRATTGFDLALTEIIEKRRHWFIAEPATDRGAAILEQAGARPAHEEERQAAHRVTESTAARMRRTVPMQGVRDLLFRNYDNPRWDAVAERCLSCGNCTLACPTCFCMTVEDSTDLAGHQAERSRRWDSCFTADFSFIHGGSVRYSVKSRYRQWMTHKLAAWIDQFGMSGCVGCGRCITWCPAGIDITEELAALRDSSPRGKEALYGDSRTDPFGPPVL